MKKLHGLLLGAVGLLVSATAAAAVTSTIPQGIISVEIRTDGAFTNSTTTIVHFVNSPNVGGTCATNYRAILIGTPEHVKAMTALATAAFLSGKKVNVTWNNNCYGTDLQIVNMRML
jgi:Flp pilus assembly secretin CpaC